MAEPQGASAGCESRGSDWSPLWLVIAIGCIWLLSSVFFLLFSSLDLILFSSFHKQPHYFSTSRLSFSPQFSSPPLPVQSFSASTHPFPLLCIFHNLFPLHPSFHLDPVWLGRTTSGSPYSLLIVRDLSASGTETETTHSLCCGFGKKIFVKFLPVLAPCAVPSDWSANSPFCWQVTGFFFLLCSYNELIISPPLGVQAEAQQIS